MQLSYPETTFKNCLINLRTLRNYLTENNFIDSRSNSLRRVVPRKGVVLKELPLSKNFITAYLEEITNDVIGIENNYNEDSRAVYWGMSWGETILYANFDIKRPFFSFIESPRYSLGLHFSLDRYRVRDMQYAEFFDNLCVGLRNIAAGKPPASKEQSSKPTKQTLGDKASTDPRPVLNADLSIAGGALTSNFVDCSSK